MLAAARIEDLDGPGLHEFVDRLQVAIGSIHDRVVATYVRAATAP
jgi:hypothetical protein